MKQHPCASIWGLFIFYRREKRWSAVRFQRSKSTWLIWHISFPSIHQLAVIRPPYVHQKAELRALRAASRFISAAFPLPRKYMYTCFKLRENLMIRCEEHKKITKWKNNVQEDPWAIVWWRIQWTKNRFNQPEWHRCSEVIQGRTSRIQQSKISVKHKKRVNYLGTK